MPRHSDTTTSLDEVTRASLEAACAALTAEVRRAGLRLDRPPSPKEARLEYTNDPFDRTRCVRATWWQGSELDGSAEVRDSGSVYAEYFVIQEHPHKSGYLVEAVEVWGTRGALRTALRVIRMPMEKDQ